MNLTILERRDEMEEIIFGNPFNLYLPKNVVYGRIHEKGWTKIRLNFYNKFSYVVNQNWSTIGFDDAYSQQFILGIIYNNISENNMRYKHFSKILGVKYVNE